MTAEESILDNLNELILDRDFRQLCSKSNEFNLFRIIKSEKNELKHSNVLAWLFNPNENHGLGSKFLEEFVFSTIPKYHIENVNFQSLYLLDFQNVEVRREWKKIDILIIIKSSDKGKSLVIPIENKIRARESKTQLGQYYSDCTQVFNEYEYSIVPIFLTPEGENPSDENLDTWNVCSYEDLLQVLEHTFEDNQSILNQQVRFFISNYLTLLRRNIMEEDKSIIELCNRIYEKYGKAIDLINQYSVVTNNVIRYKNALIEVIEKKSDLGLVKTEDKYKNYLKFCTNHISDYIKQAFPNVSKLIEYSIEFTEEDVYLRLQIVPSDNKAARDDLYCLLHNNASIFNKAKKEKPSTQGWISVYSMKLLSKKDTSDEDGIEAKVESVKNNFSLFLEGDFKKIDGFFARKTSESVVTVYSENTSGN
mgnify:FL=1